MRRRINRKHISIPSCLQCISRSRSARKDPRRVPSTFALHPWQFRGIPRIDPISSLADRKSRKRSTSRAACRPATRRFASFQSSLATTCLFLLLLILSALLLTLTFCSTSSSSSPTTFTTASSCSSLPIRALSKSERARLTNKEEILPLLVFEEVLFTFVFYTVCLSAHPVNTPPKKIKEEKEYTFLIRLSLFSTRTGHHQHTHKQTALYSHSLLVVVVVVRTHINCSVVFTLLIRGGGKKKI